MLDGAGRLAVAARTVAGQASPSASPTPSAPRGLDPNKVTPGLEGFVAILVLAVVTVLLIRSMVRRVRRIRFRAERSGELVRAPLPERPPGAPLAPPARGLRAAPAALEEPPPARPPGPPRRPATGTHRPDEPDEEPRTP